MAPGFEYKTASVPSVHFHEQFPHDKPPTGVIPTVSGTLWQSIDPHGRASYESVEMIHNVRPPVRRNRSRGGSLKKRPLSSVSADQIPPPPKEVNVIEEQKCKLPEDSFASSTDLDEIKKQALGSDTITFHKTFRGSDCNIPCESAYPRIISDVDSGRLTHPGDPALSASASSFNDGTEASIRVLQSCNSANSIRVAGPAPRTVCCGA